MTHAHGTPFELSDSIESDQSEDRSRLASFVDYLLGPSVSRSERPVSEHAVVWFVLFAGAILKIIFICDTIGSDDIRYFHFAERLAHFRAFDTLDHAGSRLAFLVLAGVPGVVLGHIVFTSLTSIFFATASEILTAFFVLRQFGVRVALVVAVFLSFSGVALVYSGTFLPDAVLTFFFAVMAIRLYLIFTQDRMSKSGDLIVIGIVTGVTYSLKDTGILLLPPIGLSLLFLPSSSSFMGRVFAIAKVAVGFAGVVVVECAALYLLSGDFLFRFHAVSSIHNEALTAADSLYDFARRGYWNFWRILERWDLLLLPSILGLWASVYVMRRRTASTVFGIIVLFCSLYMLFGTSSLTRLVNLPFQERYIQPLLPAIAVALAFMYSSMSRRLRILAVSLVIICAGTGLTGALDRVGERYFEGFLQNASIGVRILPERGNQVYVDQRTYDGLVRVLPEEDTRLLRLIPEGRNLPDGYYLVYASPTMDRERLKQIEAQPIALEVNIDQRLVADLFPQLIRDARYPARFRRVSKSNP